MTSATVASGTTDAPTETSAKKPRRSSARQRLWVWLTLAVVSLVNLISSAPLQKDAHLHAWGDALQYYAMSEHTGAPVENPFALRMLSPWLVHLAHNVTGLSLDALWLTFTYLVTVATAVVFFEFARSYLKTQLFTAFVATVLLASTFWYVQYNLSDPYLVDPLNNLLYVIAIWLAFRRKLVLFALVILVGSLNKETTLLLAPLYPLLAWTRTRSLRDKDVLGGLAALLVAAAGYFGYRVWAQHFIGGDYGFGAGQHNGSLLENIRFSLSSHKGTEQAVLWDTFHFVWLIFGYGLFLQYRKHGIRSPMLVASLWLFLCCLAGRFVATDTTRVFVMMAPLVLGMFAVVLDRHRSDAARLWVSVLAFLYLAINFRWVPWPASFALDAGALVVFALLTFPPKWPSPPRVARPTPADAVTEEFLMPPLPPLPKAADNN
ncbi:hypothetical protein VSH64_38200 [Amycolatopsis rhabdoformis]|uniref:DUF2029 domain-containing protein n=1 Tax=Amycolatopsis rhabdoformis TaxID=1448059 RepID=A0ABZ1I2M5_9PSEU|nr:hypothetical protein [Amycolatopsis rhabdoformis]WSE28618.1 hypothetical protein VSH64_38200 [Amycolatopsis rhabdoformis]